MRYALGEELQMAEAGHIRRFGKISAFNRNLYGVKCIVANKFSNVILRSSANCEMAKNLMGKRGAEVLSLAQNDTG